MKKLIFTLAAVMALAVAMPTVVSGQDPARNATVTYEVDMHCDNCVRSIESRIPFERGVKDVRVRFDDQEVDVDYDPRKTDPEKILASLHKIKPNASLKQ